MATAEQIQHDFKTAFINKAGELKTFVDKTKDLDKDAKSFEALNDLGFKNSATFRSYKEVVKDKSTEATKLSRVLDILNTSFIAKYPQYPVIGFATLVQLLKKYNLYLGYSSLFTAPIPEKNIKEIQEHKNSVRLLTNYYYKFLENPLGLRGDRTQNRQGMTPACYFAAAPRRFFTKKAVCIGNNLLVKRPDVVIPPTIYDIKDDPIIMSPFEIEGHVFMQVVTIWGPEAEIKEFNIPKDEYSIN